ncbi:MAG: ImmA/IrrE family metallo-endopeptidase [Phycisphaerales bacterium]
MTPSEYYKQMQVLARSTRTSHGIAGPKVTRSDLRRVYKALGITIDLWPYPLKGIRGAYFNDQNGPSVLLAKSLPTDPLVFTMAHELKHHLVDGQGGVSLCLAENQSAMIEIGAEVFAAEFLFPEEEFAQRLVEMKVGPGACTPEHLVHLKKQSQTTLSYAGMVKRAERLGFLPRGSTAKVAWKRLEEQLYGVPVYKRFRRSPKH